MTWWGIMLWICKYSLNRSNIFIPHAVDDRKFALIKSLVCEWMKVVVDLFSPSWVLVSRLRVNHYSIFHYTYVSKSYSSFYICPWKSWISFSRLLLYLNPYTILFHAACFAELTALLVSLHFEFFKSLSCKLFSSSLPFPEYLSLSLHCIVDFSLPPPRFSFSKLKHTMLIQQQ